MFTPFPTFRHHYFFSCILGQPSSPLKTSADTSSSFWWKLNGVIWPTDPNYDKEESFPPLQLGGLDLNCTNCSHLFSVSADSSPIFLLSQISLNSPLGSVNLACTPFLLLTGCCDDRWPAGLAVWVGPSPSLSVNQPFSSSPLKTSDISPLELNWEKECRSPAGESGIGIWQEAMRPLTEATGERDRGGDLSKWPRLWRRGMPLRS